MTQNDCLEKISYYLELQNERELTQYEELDYDYVDKLYSLYSITKLLVANGVKPGDVENHFVYKIKFKQAVDAKIKLDTYKE